jgi:hypothetical protein
MKKISLILLPKSIISYKKIPFPHPSSSTPTPKGKKFIHLDRIKMRSLMGRGFAGLELGNDSPFPSFIEKIPDMGFL